jgi:outer membrane protein TolC
MGKGLKQAWSGMVLGLLATSAHAQTDAGGMRPVFTRQGAILRALEQNPDIAVIRKNRGIAAAGVVIARTYPFNPVWQSYVWGDNGPKIAFVTNHVAVAQTMRLDLELWGQGRYRRQAAEAAVTRTEWEIAFQELGLAIRTVRAFNALVYRREKLRLVEEGIQLQEKAEQQVRRLVEQNKLNAADLLLTRADVVESRTQRGPARAFLVQAEQEFRRALGLVGEDFDLDGALDGIPPPPTTDGLLESALENRPDRHALQMAVAEAEARIRLEIANRIPNPSIGPAYERNETSVDFIGSWLIWQLPVLNLRKGEIQQRRAERDRALADFGRVEAAIRLDVQAALARLADARKAADLFQEQAIPALEKTLKGLEKLFEQGQAGADLGRLVDVRRRLLRARDARLDALWELSQAEADLAAAVGDPALAALDPTASPAEPVELPPRAILLPPQ